MMRVDFRFGACGSALNRQRGGPADDTCVYRCGVNGVGSLKLYPMYQRLCVQLGCF